MKKPKLAINLGWGGKRHIENEYEKMFLICKDNNINFVRIFLCSWSINTLYDMKYLNTLLKIINLANKNEIEVCIVINNFVDYNIGNYSDINDKKYSWLYNPYYSRYKKVKNFFKNIDDNYLKKIINILKQVSKYKNVKYIEIMNEIDQVECSNRILINWTNKLVHELEIIFKNRYQYTCSISNHQLYDYFRKNLGCYTDLHFYSFPYNHAIENIEYIRSKQNILYLGEYAKYSDNDYIDDINSKIYFTSGLWSSYFYKLEYSPLHWWWKQLLSNKEYINIIKNYNMMINKIGLINQIEKINVEYKIIENINNKLEKKKVKTRLVMLIKHPLFIIKEFKNIKKYLNKKRTKQNNVIVRKIILNNSELYYLECDKDIILETNLNKNNIVNLQTNQNNKFNKRIYKGNYFIF